VRFYERKEIKDMIAYLTVLLNPADNLRLSRIINEPKRGIGQTTVESARDIADGLGRSLFSVLCEAGQFELLQKKESVISAFTGMMQSLSELLEDDKPLDFILDEILEQTGYRAMLESQGFEGAGRLENILELKSTLIRYQEANPDGSLGGFLEEISLYTDLDNYDPGSDAVVLMTIHSAKGLEFDTVFIAGMDEGIFPGNSAMLNPKEVEEERRLAYVAITRAKKKLVITTAQKRMFFGRTIYSRPSRFIEELPEGAVTLTDNTTPQRPAQAKPQTKAPRGPGGAATSITVGGRP